MGVTLYTTGSSEKDNCRRWLEGFAAEDFFKMLLEPLVLAYEYVGCCIVE